MIAAYQIPPDLTPTPSPRCAAPNRAHTTECPALRGDSDPHALPLHIRHKLSQQRPDYFKDVLDRPSHLPGRTTPNRLIPSYANSALRSLFNCPTQGDYATLLGELLACEPLLLTAIKDSCISLVGGTLKVPNMATRGGEQVATAGNASKIGGAAVSANPIIVQHPLPGNSSRILVPLTIHPLVVRRPYVQHTDTSAVQQCDTSAGKDRVQAAVQEPQQQLLAAVILRYTLSGGLYGMHKQIQRCLTALSELPSSVTLLSGDGRRVLFQNTASVQYMGLRQGMLPPPQPRHQVASINNPAPRKTARWYGGGGAVVDTATGGDVVPLLASSAYENRSVSFGDDTDVGRGLTTAWQDTAESGSGRRDVSSTLGQGLLQELFSSSLQQWQEVVVELAARRRWKGIVQVPHLLTRHLTVPETVEAKEVRQPPDDNDGDGGGSDNGGPKDGAEEAAVDVLRALSPPAPRIKSSMVAYGGTQVGPVG